MARFARIDLQICANRLILANHFRVPESRAAKRGGFQTGGFPDLDLSFLFCPFLSFPDFSGIFPILLGDGPGIFPDLSFSSFSAYMKSTYEEQSRKGPRHNLDLPEKSGKHPGLETPRFSFSQPKDPSVLKIVRRANSLRREKNLRQ